MVRILPRHFLFPPESPRSPCYQRRVLHHNRSSEIIIPRPARTGFLTVHSMYIRCTIDKIQVEYSQRAKANSNKKKHGVSFEEAQSVFYDEFAVQFFDEKSAGLEDRFLMLGFSDEARLLIVCCHCDNVSVIKTTPSASSRPEKPQKLSVSVSLHPKITDTHQPLRLQTIVRHPRLRRPQPRQMPERLLLPPRQDRRAFADAQRQQVANFRARRPSLFPVARHPVKRTRRDGRLSSGNATGLFAVGRLQPDTPCGAHP